MPPRKQQLPRREVRALIREHGIRFEGPVPQKRWPQTYAHHFQTIRQISRIWYDEYKCDRDIPKARRRDFKQRANRLREFAYHLLDDVNINESTWREFEPLILKRFSEPIICHRCHHDVWKSDYEAKSLHFQAEVDLKRSERRMCLCGSATMQAVADNSDEENGAIFDFAKEAALSHAPTDNLDSLKLSMQPDRVVGLRSPVRIPYDASLFPVTGRGILLPFLVIEAKKEHNAPGFRAIQCQTAFVIRRLLMAQDSLLKQFPSSEPPLVWFFAFQGEQWRLQICTYDDSKAPVKFYDAWEGTVQRQDDALQLLLIVDYIWSWARDIYRPSVRTAVYDSVLSGHDRSPASTDRFRHSVSFSSATPVPEPFESDMMQIDHDEDDALDVCIDSASEAEDKDSEQLQSATILLANNHDFLKWAVGHEAAPSWTKFGSIRHSNLIQFEFQVVVGHRRDLESAMADFASTPALQGTFLLRSDQLLQLAALWIPHARPLISPDFPGSERISILFYTNFDQSTWQIKRGLLCVIWQRSSEGVLPAEDSYQLGLHPEISTRLLIDLREALLDVQQLSGRTSVYYALQNVTMLLMENEDGVKWISGNTSDTVERLYEAFAQQTITKQIAIPASPYRRPSGGDQTERCHSSIPPDLLLDTRKGNSMLIVRSDSWLEECPKFCLFVLLDEYPDDCALLHRLLQEARRKKNFYGDYDYKLTCADGEILRKWSNALKDGA